MSRPQIFGIITGAELATSKLRVGFIRVRLEDGHELVIPATDAQVAGVKLTGFVRMPVMPTTDKTIAKLRVGDTGDTGAEGGE